MDELAQRRHGAADALMEAISRIADDYEVCPVCLLQVVAEALRVSVTSGEITHLNERHAGDEWHKGTLQ